MPFVQIFDAREWAVGVKICPWSVCKCVSTPCTCVPLQGACTSVVFSFFSLTTSPAVRGSSLSLSLSLSLSVFKKKREVFQGFLHPSPLSSLMHEELRFSTGCWFINYIYSGPVWKEINCTPFPTCVRDHLYIYSDWQLRNSADPFLCAHYAFWFSVLEALGISQHGNGCGGLVWILP